MFSKIHSAQVHLLKAHIVDVETDIGKGLHAFSIVGLADKAVDESKDRVSAALKNSGYESPKNKNEKIVVSLAPADLKKEGPVFDVAIALGYLLSSELISFDSSDKIFLGELSLDGKIRPITGTLPLVVEAKKKKYKEIYVPKGNAKEASLVSGIKIYAPANLKELVEHLNENEVRGERGKKMEFVKNMIPKKLNDKDFALDFDDIEGNETAKRGLVIAAAGGHNVALYGPPGTGKTMLARALASILPPLSFDQMLEVTAIHSVAGTLTGDYITEPPIRAPHHTASYVSLVGGGTIPKPGEVTLAHNGVLFLDEFPEFDKRVIETLRGPLEDRVISVSRARGSANFPANFILVAAMNPCPCGNFGTEGKVCTCLPQMVLRYQKKISGPIIDRIDMWIEVAKVDHDKLLNKKERGKETFTMKNNVVNARKKQEKRLGSKLNSEIKARSIREDCALDDEAKEILLTAAKNLDLSARACHRMMKLSRTIADLENSDVVTKNHVLEALQYRPKKFEL